MNTSFFGELLQTISERGRALLGPRPARRCVGALRKPRRAVRGSFVRPGRGLRRRARPRNPRRVTARSPSVRASPSSRRWRSAFGTDTARMDQAIDAWRASPSDATAAEVHVASEPRRQELFRRLNLAPGGTAALVRMREQLMDSLDHRDDLRAVDDDFVHLFSSWFNRGFLVLRQHRLVDAGDRAGEDHPLRGGARNRATGRICAAASTRRTGAVSPFFIRQWSTSR